MKLVAGLGNPGKEYENTRHNTGRIVVGLVEKKLEDQKIKFITPDNFMNNSGKAVAPLVKTKKDLENLVVVYDDIDLPLGKIKISFNRSAGGHNGLGSIIKALKSQTMQEKRRIIPIQFFYKRKFLEKRNAKVDPFLFAQCTPLSRGYRGINWSLRKYVMKSQNHFLRPTKLN